MEDILPTGEVREVFWHSKGVVPPLLAWLPYHTDLKTRQPTTYLGSCDELL